MKKIKLLLSLSLAVFFIAGCFSKEEKQFIQSKEIKNEAFEKVKIELDTLGLKDYQLSKKFSFSYFGVAPDKSSVLIKYNFPGDPLLLKYDKFPYHAKVAVNGSEDIKTASLGEVTQLGLDFFMDDYIQLLQRDLYNPELTKLQQAILTSDENYKTAEFKVEHVTNQEKLGLALVSYQTELISDMTLSEKEALVMALVLPYSFASDPTLKLPKIRLIFTADTYPEAEASFAELLDLLKSKFTIPAYYHIIVASSPEAEVSFNYQANLAVNTQLETEELEIDLRY